MEREYSDKDGIKHDLEIFESQLNGETVYTIHKNGYYFLDLVLDAGVWTEVYGGKTERSEEYGTYLSSLLTL